MPPALHSKLVKGVKKDLRDEGEKILSPRSWIGGPIIPDIISYSEPVNFTHPRLIIIEIKNSVDDLQRALFQLLAARACLSRKNLDMYAFFFTAISKKVYEKLHELAHLDVYLRVMRPDKIWSLGIGLVVLNEHDPMIWKNRTVLIKAADFMV